MVSSKFSRRPRVQPKPKVCHPPPPPPPPRQPPDWPIATMLCTLDWDAVMEPPPHYDIHLTLPLPWQPAVNRYYAQTPGWPHYVQISFYLDLLTGRYHVHMAAWQWISLWTTVESHEGYLTPNQHIDLTITDWLGQLPLNVISARFRTSFP